MLDDLLTESSTFPLLHGFNSHLSLSQPFRFMLGKPAPRQGEPTLPADHKIF
jgi:hypothetical protein